VNAHPTLLCTLCQALHSGSNIANGDMLPLRNPGRKLHVDSSGMLGAHKMVGATGKSPNDGAVVVDTDPIPMAALENRPFLVFFEGVTDVDVRSDIATGKTQ
jgi:hypothetical protein